MPIVIKEIRVNTVVEKKIISRQELSDDILRTIKDEVQEELEERQENHPQEKKEMTVNSSSIWNTF